LFVFDNGCCSRSTMVLCPLCRRHHRRRRLLLLTFVLNNGHPLSSVSSIVVVDLVKVPSRRECTIVGVGSFFQWMLIQVLFLRWTKRPAQQSTNNMYSRLVLVYNDTDVLKHCVVLRARFLSEYIPYNLYGPWYWFLSRCWCHFSDYLNSVTQVSDKQPRRGARSVVLSSTLA
jgi:hypothetical protein